MSVAIVVQVIIALLVAGFILYAGRLLISKIPLEPVIAGVIDAIIVICAVAIVLFWVVIPILNLLAGVHIPVPAFK